MAWSFFAAGAMLLAGGVVLWRAASRPWRESRFRRHARSATGRVLTVRRHVVVRENGWRDAEYAYTPTVRFELPDGRVVETEVFERRDDPLGEGLPVDLRYDSRDPTRARLAGGAAMRWTAGVELWLLGFGLVVMGLVFLVGSFAEA